MRSRSKSTGAATGRNDRTAALGSAITLVFVDLVNSTALRAALPGGGTFVNAAVRVLRDCRMETPEGDPRLPERLLMLGRALVLVALSIVLGLAAAAGGYYVGRAIN